MNGQSARGGLSVTPLRHLEVGAGLGIERVAFTILSPQDPASGYETSGYLLTGRLLVRAGPVRVADVSVSATALVDVGPAISVQTTSISSGETIEVIGRVRPGLSLDVWWR